MKMRVLPENVLNHIPSGTSYGIGIVVTAKLVECVLHESRAVRICREMLSQLEDRKNEVLEFFLRRREDNRLIPAGVRMDCVQSKNVLIEHDIPLSDRHTKKPPQEGPARWCATTRRFTPQWRPRFHEERRGGPLA